MENEQAPRTGGLPVRGRAQTGAQSGELAPLRTYERDVEEILHGENISLSKIALAESVKRRAAPLSLRGQGSPSLLASPTRIPMPQAAARGAGSPLWSAQQGAGDGRGFRSLLLFGIPIGLALGAIGLAWYLWGDAGSGETTVPFEPKITEAENAGVILSGERRAAFIKRVRDESAKTQVPLGEFRIIPLKKKTGEETEPLAFTELLGAVEAGAPPALVRALEPVPLFGIHGIRGNQPFLLFSVTSYDHAFDGMLLWEKEILQDIGLVFGVDSRALLNAPASTTAETLARRLSFRDVVVRNKDIRAVFDAAGRIIFLYSFLDKQSLLITTNEDTFRALLLKVSKGRIR